MKKLFRTAIVLFAAVFLFQACDDGLTDINVNPTQADQLDPQFKFTRAVLQAAEDEFETWRGNLIHASSMIQHLSSTITGWSGDRYTINNEYTGAFWNVMYPNTVKTIEDIMAQVQDDPDMVNMYAQTRILRVFVYHRLTDFYGDIPYSEAGQGFTEGISNPAYDPQEEIYRDMINELTEAVASLSEGPLTFGSNDLLYSGDVDQWRRFGNSLKLRLGMRLSEVDPSFAQATVEAAAAGGLMQSNDDIAWVNHVDQSGINRNAIGSVFQNFGLTGHGFAMSDTFVNILLDAENGNANIDPRLTRIARVYDSDGNVATTDPLEYRGVPNGLDGSAISNNWGLGDPETRYAMPNRENMAAYDSPYLFMTYAEVRFVLAEAAARGWNVPGDAQTHYEAGIDAAMRHLSLYGLNIPDSEIQDYIANVPPADLEQIAIQKWIALFLNGYEAYADWRRTGYPQLTPVNAPGNVTGGTIPRRIIYPVQEPANNRSNYEAAVSRQGPDEFTTRMWWDVQ
ncbi:MAG: SusD/RagB family nutrient-binding outer membrane lipoprotein [Balneolaceae bacterium]|nr:SusD/RagB family nutrient-binding outer membrane lipoprotein [Balneolaceae bacterium]